MKKQYLIVTEPERLKEFGIIVRSQNEYGTIYRLKNRLFLETDANRIITAYYDLSFKDMLVFYDLIIAGIVKKVEEK
jgi:hypothetical protein